MRYKKLLYKGETIRNNKRIEKILSTNEFYWLIDSEIENADIEIKNNTLVWNSGNYYTGNWYYGIFKGGNFHGNFKNGIFEDGNFKGNWESGIRTNQQ